MKKAELTAGDSYWISKDSKWATNPDPEAGWIGTYTGETLGLDAEFVDTNNETHLVRFVDVRATLRDASSFLAYAWSEFNEQQERLSKLRRMANVVMADDRFGLGNLDAIADGKVTIDATGLELLLNTARRAQKAAKP